MFNVDVDVAVLNENQVDKAGGEIHLDCNSDILVFDLNFKNRQLCKG